MEEETAGAGRKCCRFRDVAFFRGRMGSILYIRFLISRPIFTFSFHTHEKLFYYFIFNTFLFVGSLIKPDEK